ncbi:MAG: hypothetical protein EBZ36_17380, partial [Acidobacteria bacterium]|nr:hypothetical protein [Acidobacteriota bacterium]
SESRLQAPALLDQRDQLLRDLSKVARIRVVEARNGAVDVSVGPSDRQGQIVIGRESRKLVASYDQQTYGVKLILDPLRAAEVVSGVSSGTLGGLINFRDQILRPAASNLDFLAQTVTTHVNATHRVGVDLDGKLGGDLLTIDPVYEINDATVKSPIAVQWDVIDPAATRFHDIKLSFDPESARWTATDQTDGRQASGQDLITFNGLQIRITGVPPQPETLILEARNRPAAGIRRLLDDPRGIAAAAPLRVIEAPANPSGVDAQVFWQPDSRDELKIRPITDFPVSSDSQIQSVEFQNSDVRPASVLGKIPANRIYPLGLNILKMYPLPNRTGTVGFNYETEVPASRPERQDLFRGDWNVNDAWRVSGKYLYNKRQVIEPYGSFVLGTNMPDFQALYPNDRYSFTGTVTG